MPSVNEKALMKTKKNEKRTAKTEYDAAKKEYNAAKKEYNAAKKALTNAITAKLPDKELNSLRSACSSTQEAKKTAEEALKTAKDALKKAKSGKLDDQPNYDLTPSTIQVTQPERMPMVSTVTINQPEIREFNGSLMSTQSFDPSPIEERNQNVCGSVTTVSTTHSSINNQTEMREQTQQIVVSGANVPNDAQGVCESVKVNEQRMIQSEPNKSFYSDENESLRMISSESNKASIFEVTSQKQTSKLLTEAEDWLLKKFNKQPKNDIGKIIIDILTVGIPTVYSPTSLIWKDGGLAEVTEEFLMEQKLIAKINVTQAELENIIECSHLITIKHIYICSDVDIQCVKNLANLTEIETMHIMRPDVPHSWVKCDPNYAPDVQFGKFSKQNLNFPTNAFPTHLKKLVIRATLSKQEIETIVNLESLECLDLAECGLSQLPDLSHKLPVLKILNLYNNEFTKFPVSVCDLKTLEHLNLSGNDFDTIPETIVNCSNLKTIMFIHNIFIRVPIKRGMAEYQNKTIGKWKQGKMCNAPACLEKLQHLEYVGISMYAFSLHTLPQAHQDAKLCCETAKQKRLACIKSFRDENKPLHSDLELKDVPLRLKFYILCKDCSFEQFVSMLDEVYHPNTEKFQFINSTTAPSTQNFILGVNQKYFEKQVKQKRIALIRAKCNGLFTPRKITNPSAADRSDETDRYLLRKFLSGLDIPYEFEMFLLDSYESSLENFISKIDQMYFETKNKPENLPLPVSNGPVAQTSKLYCDFSSIVRDSHKLTETL
jgi:hypothetical protein